MSKLPNKSGIYRIICISSNKVYVGSAINMRARQHRHLFALKGNTHTNKYLQRAYNKYGKAKFKFEVVELIVDAANLIEREQHWLDLTGAGDASKCFNICTTAGNTKGLKTWLGKRHSEATRLKMSITRKALVKRGADNNLSKQVCQYKLDGTFVKLWGSMQEAADSIGVVSTNISRCARGKSRTCKGFQWKYYTGPLTNIERTLVGSSIEIAQYTLEGMFVGSYKNAVKAGSSVGCSGSSVTKCVKGKVKTCKGFKWGYYFKGCETIIKE